MTLLISVTFDDGEVFPLLKKTVPALCLEEALKNTQSFLWLILECVNVPFSFNECKKLSCPYYKNIFHFTKPLAFTCITLPSANITDWAYRLSCLTSNICPWSITACRVMGGLGWSPSQLRLGGRHCGREVLCNPSREFITGLTFTVRQSHTHHLRASHQLT